MSTIILTLIGVIFGVPLLLLAGFVAVWVFVPVVRFLCIILALLVLILFFKANRGIIKQSAGIQRQ